MQGKDVRSRVAKEGRKEGRSRVQQRRERKEILR